jgi:hypothetical protein
MMDLVVLKTIGVVDFIKAGKEFKKIDLRRHRLFKRHWKSQEAKCNLMLRFGRANWTCSRYGVWSRCRFCVDCWEKCP